MKRKLLVQILIIEAVICLLLYFVRDSLPAVFTTLAAFPFEQLGFVLRYLSLSGAFGNIVSLILYGLISLSPVIFYLTVRKKKNVFTEDLLLFVLSAILFVMIYYMVNPGMMSAVFSVNIPSQTGKAILSLTFYTVLMGYGVLKILRRFYDAGIEKITNYLRILLSFLSGYFVLLIFGEIFGRFMSARDALYTGNTGLGDGIASSEAFLFLQYAAMALPYLLNIIVVLSIIEFLKAMGKDRYSEEASLKADALSRLCRKTLTIIVGTSIGFHVLQFMFLKTLAVVNTTLEIPFMPLIFILSVLMLTQFVRENKTLKQDNDMFI